MIENVREIGIVDTRNIIKIVQEAYAYDFSNYLLTSLKFRIEKYIQSLNNIPVDLFTKRLLDDYTFFDSFLHAISIGSGSMFQDPSMWRHLRDELIPENSRNIASYKIWLPRCITGNELFSMSILLHESGLNARTRLFASCLAEKTQKQISSGESEIKVAEQSEQNYTRFNPGKSLLAFQKQTENKVLRDTSLITPVSFDKQGILLDKASAQMNLILFRNQTLYYNNTLKNTVIENLSRALVPGGYLILGNKENLEKSEVISHFKLISESESIYKKKH